MVEAVGEVVFFFSFLAFWEWDPQIRSTCTYQLIIHPHFYKYRFDYSRKTKYYFRKFEVEGEERKINLNYYSSNFTLPLRVQSFKQQLSPSN